MKGYALKKWESTLNFVFMPMDDVYLIMEAARKNNYSFGISSSYIWDLAFCNRGSDHVLL